MGLFDRFRGNKGDDAQPAEVPVPFKTFRKFQTDMQEGMRAMRGEFNKVIEENHNLKKQVIGFTSRLDDIEREQLKMGNDNAKNFRDLKAGIKSISGSVVDESAEDKSGIEVKKVTSAQNALNALSGRLATPTNDGAKLKPF